MANVALLAEQQESAPVAVLPADQPSPAAAKGETTLELVELLLKDPGRLQQLNRDPRRQGELVPRFLLIAVAGYLVYSCTMVLLINLAPAATGDLGPVPLPLPPARWDDGSALGLPLAYTLSIVLASCVCLPSFYFYSLLAGVRITWLQIVGLITRATAYNGVILLGVVPIYVALMMGLIIFASPPDVVRWSVVVGLALPFVAGLWGLRAIHRGIVDLAAEMPPEWRCRRECLLRRLTLAWGAVYTAVLPVMIYRLWEYVARTLAAL
jgi:hypothetical protein